MIDRTHALPVVRQAELAGLSRASVYYLQREDFKVGRRHVATLMVRMGIEALYRKPNTSRKHPRNKVYPYLLRGLKITRANHVWATDITYIPMAHGWVYLCAIVDWASRRVLAHRISITMETGFCLEALNEAIAKHGTPEIFNTDQGRQGGFNRSSQHLQPEGVYGTTCGMDETVNWQRCDAITWRAIASARSGAAVLAADRDWNHE